MFLIDDLNLVSILGFSAITLSLILYINSRRELPPFTVSIFPQETKLIFSIFLAVIGFAFLCYDLGVRIDRPMIGKNSNSHFYLDKLK